MAEEAPSFLPGHSVRKVLCLFAHPNTERSRANRRVIESLQGLPSVTIHAIYDLYPEFYIDVKKEQALLLAHDAIMFQHPFYWYSMPPLLKLWMDCVLEFGWAYGPGGNKLAGKDFLLSITAGGPLDSYGPEGYNKFPMEAFFPAFEQTARLCGMKWHKPSVLHHSSKAGEELLLRHAEAVRDRVSALTLGKS
jgi:glutathione-regulated potassium-efflux system ancillary protein KefG